MSEKSKKIRLMKKWISALRSGEYKQGKGFLYSKDRYCCLGVLCDIAPKKFGLKKQDYGFTYKLHEQPHEADLLLPDELRNYLGLDSHADGAFGSDYEHVLCGLNDNGKRFKTISNYIEKNILPKLEES